MSSERAALLATIRENPDDDVPRLVYADWLMEHDETTTFECNKCYEVSGKIHTPHPNRAGVCYRCFGKRHIIETNGYANRAEFIRLQIRIAELEQSCTCGGCVRKRGGGRHTNGPCVVDRERVTLPDGSNKPVTIRNREQQLRPVIIIQGNGNPWSPGDGLWRRGFVEHVAGSWEQWLANHEAVLAHPVVVLREVRLTTWPPYEADWTGAEGEEAWFDIRNWEGQQLRQITVPVGKTFVLHETGWKAVEMFLAEEYPGHCPGHPPTFVLPPEDDDGQTNLACEHCNGAGGFGCYDGLNETMPCTECNGTGVAQ